MEIKIKVLLAKLGLDIHNRGVLTVAKNLRDADLKIHAVEFHYPFTTIEEICVLGEEMVFIPYIMLDKQDRFSTTEEFYRYLLNETGHRYWFACAEDTLEMIEFAAEAASHS